MPGGEQFANAEIAVVLAVAGADGEAAHRRHAGFRFFVRRGERFEPLPSDARDATGQDQLTGGALLPDGTIALATVSRGLLIMDDQAACFSASIAAWACATITCSRC